MSWGSDGSELAPGAAPPWLKPLVDNAKDVKRAYRRRVPPEVLAMVTAANTKAAVTGERRDAAVLVLFSGPPDSPSGGVPDDADLLVTVRASTLRHRAEHHPDERQQGAQRARTPSRDGGNEGDREDGEVEPLRRCHSCASP